MNTRNCTKNINPRTIYRVFGIYALSSLRKIFRRIFLKMSYALKFMSKNIVEIPIPYIIANH